MVLDDDSFGTKRKKAQSFQFPMINIIQVQKEDEEIKVSEMIARMDGGSEIESLTNQEEEMEEEFEEE